MSTLIIYRSGSPLVTVHVGSDTMYKGVVMASDKIVAKFSSPTMINFVRGDYIQHNGQAYRLDKIPESDKWSSRGFTYNAEFEGLSYRLYDRVLRHLGNIDFSYFGTPNTLLQLILDNINEIDPTWTAGSVEAITEGKTIQFPKMTCREALTKIAQEFELEYSFNGKEINLVKSVGITLSGLTVEYGQGNGLYNLVRKNTDSRIYTRFLAVGGSQNLPPDYRGGMKNLSIDGGAVERNVGLYGEIEIPVVRDDIFPRRSAAITSAPLKNEVIDSTLDFDLNSVIIEGQAKIHFKTGDLAGNDFEILSYNHGTKRIKFAINKEESGYELPNNVVKPAAGDTYTLLGITMPGSYIIAAEVELQAAVVQYADIHQYQLNAYDLAIDEKFIRDNNWTGLIRAGDRLHTVDADMTLNAYLRIQEISYPLNNPSQIMATLSEEVVYTLTEKIIKAQAKARQDVVVLEKNIEQGNRANSIRLREFEGMVFDPDGYFEPGNIKPESINTIHLAVGTRSQDFSLSVIFRPNYMANPANIIWESGSLVHNTVDDTAVKTWSIASGSRNDLVAGTAYYIYARCEKTTLDGTVVLDTVKRRINDDATYYYFLIGMLSSVISGVRWPSFTYGSSELNGRFLTTGRIQSIAGTTYFDLDSSEIAGTIKFIPAGGGALKLVSTVNTETAAAQSSANTANAAAIAAQAAANAAAQAAIDAEAAALAYTNAQTALSLVQAQAYTDGVVSVEETARIADATAKLNEAKADATTKADAALAAAQSDATTKANAAKTAAETYAAAQANAATVTSNAYADGIVDAEEARAIADAQAKLALAYADATSKANAAQNAAVAAAQVDATNKANAAQAAAQTYAAAQATLAQTTASAYADGIVDAEEARAISDATAKLAEAKADATTKANVAAAAAAAAQLTANEAKGVTDNFTVISGGLISSNTIKLGTQAQDVAGVTGVGTAADSIRFWAGQSYANRTIAPFRVDQSGNLVATNATISGNIIANSGTIGGITINANDLFTLSGSKVEILPNSGIRVYAGGYADFAAGTLKIPSAAPALPAVGNIWITDAAAVGSAPANFSTLASLQDIAIGAQTSGQALVWNSTTGKWVPGTVAAGNVDLSNYYNKTEIQNFYSGAIAISGYSKSLWDAAYTNSHTHGNKSFLDGITSGATVAVNITGNSVTTSQRTFGNVRTDGVNRGGYGTTSIAGTNNGYGGIDFTDHSVTLMMNYNTQGVLKDNNAWWWYFSNGVLIEGTVPAARISGLTNAATITADTAANVNTIALRDASGHLFGNYGFFNYLNTPDSIESSATYFVVKNGDNYHRSLSVYNSMAAIRAVADGSWAINVTGTAGHATGSSRLYANESYYAYGSTNPYFLKMNYNSSAGMWRLTVSPETPTSVSVYHSDITSQRTFDRVRTNGINRGLYGSISISGTTGGYAGIDFSDTAVTLMANNLAQGIYANDASWQWLWENGTLSVGTVPVARISGLSNAAAITAQVGSSASTILQRDGSGNITTEQTINFNAYGRHWTSTPSYLQSASPVRSAESFTAPNFYAEDGWFRTNNKSGLYNSLYNGHFYQSTSNYWSINGGAAGTMGLQFRSGHESTVYGYVYYDASGFGLLNGGSWAVRTFAGGGGELNGSWNATGNMTVNGNYYVSNYGQGLVGIYSATRYQNVFSMGESYKPLADGTTLSNMYGIAYTHSSIGGYSIASLGHQTLFVEAGSTRTAIGNGIWTNGNIGVGGESDFRSEAYGNRLSRSAAASHGSWELSGYSKAGWNGLNIIDPSGYFNNFMFAGGNGGWYRENNTGGSKWILYYLQSHGCLGIGTTSTNAGYAARIGGHVYTDGWINCMSVGYFAGDVIAYFSDERLKEKITLIENPLEIINKLRGVNYTANDLALSLGAAKDKRQQVGVIAQDFEDIMPEVLERAPFDMTADTLGSKSGAEYKTVKYERIVPLLIEAIKELTAKVEMLEGRANA